MLNPIKEIVKWQVDAGNASKPYDDFLESSFQVEEALEGFEMVEDLYFSMNPEHELAADKSTQVKQTSRLIIRRAQSGHLDEITEYTISDVDRLDKACDAIVYAIGSMTKLGLDHHAITKALNIVNNANKAKLGAPRDEAGKLLKADDFVGPEVELQLLLDKR